MTGADGMRRRVLVATSDLHADITSLEEIAAMRRDLLQHAERDGFDIAALLVLGDVGESLKGIGECLGILRDVAPVCVVIPGNHDLFDTECIGSSVKRYEEFLPQLVMEAGFLWGISADPVMIDSDTAIVTTTAWPRPELVIGGVALDAAAIREAHHYIPDGHWITKDLKHAALSDAQLAIFERALAAVPEGVKRLVIGTHYPIFVEQLEGAAILPSTAWYVSPRFGECVHTLQKARPGLKIEVISAHLHRSVETSARGIPARVILSGYRKPGYLMVPL